MVDQFVYLGSLLTDNTSAAEVKRHTGLGYGALNGLWKNQKSRDISIKTKLNVLQTYVFSIVLYGVEMWTLRKEKLCRLDAFERGSFRRLMDSRWLH